VNGVWTFVVGNCILGLCIWSEEPMPTFKNYESCELAATLYDELRIVEHSMIWPLYYSDHLECFNWIEQLKKDK